MIVANGQAAVTATANTTPGSYGVTASAAGSATAADFALTNAHSLVVDTVLDELDPPDGKTSLREALAYAESLPGPSTITFDPAVFGTTPQTITLTDGPLTFTDANVTIRGPGAQSLTISGGGTNRVFDIEGGSATLSGLTVSGGNATNGGGLYDNRGTLDLTDCTVTGNSGSGEGGGLFNNSYSTLELTDCTVSGNRAGNNGGGLYTAAVGSSLALSNVTVGGNYAGECGGGLFLGGGTSTLSNCTISGNSAGVVGGGLYVFDTPTLTNSIVAGQTSAGDVHGALNAASANNLVGDGSGMTGISDGSQGNQVGTAAAPIDPLLAPLSDYGGPTATMALLPGSPAIAGGANAQGTPATDQRGQPRTGHVDIGAFQSRGFTLAPVAGSTPQSAAIGTKFANTLAVTVTAVNPVEPVDGGIVNFAAPASGASAALSAATATIEGGQANVTATANATPGPYTALATAAGAGYASFSMSNLAASSLSETPPPTQPTGPSEQVITDLAGLRAAITYADSHPGPDTITFDPAPSGKKRWTIKPSGGPLVLSNPATTTIIGPGPGLLTINGDGQGSVFVIEGGSLALDGVTISGGRAVRGGGIRNDGGRLVLTDVVIRGNRARVGGGLYNDGTAVLNDVVIRGNQARIGSGLFSTRRATLTWSRSPAGGRR